MKQARLLKNIKLVGRASLPASIYRRLRFFVAGTEARATEFFNSCFKQLRLPVRFIRGSIVCI